VTTVNFLDPTSMWQEVSKPELTPRVIGILLSSSRLRENGHGVGVLKGHGFEPCRKSFR